MTHPHSTGTDHPRDPPSDGEQQLQFSVFPEPRAQAPDAVVELAVLSERWGYDMVTIQDHPYQSGYLGTWTLLTWIAARTDRVLIGPNVLNMAVRSPVITAKSAATLDLLSHGRVVLGLGAGFAWDAISTLGIDRHTNSQAVDALDEALDVIRAAWPTTSPTNSTADTSTTDTSAADGYRADMAPVSVAGRYHRLDGLLPGRPPRTPSRSGSAHPNRGCCA